jgi:hypothetical protein
MQLPEFEGDSRESNLRDYATCSEYVWSKEILAYQQRINTEYQKKSIIHCRFGDLVDGDWRNWVDPRKHITALQIEEVLQNNSLKGIPTHIISGSKEVFQVFPLAKVSGALGFDGLKKLNVESLQAITDLMAMKSSKEIFAPQESAFSVLGAKLGGKSARKLTRSKIDIRQAVENIKLTKILWSRVLSKKVGAFLSRDIDQQLNSLNGIYDLNLFGEITMEALVADPTNVASLSNRALFHSFSGNFGEVQKLLDQAKTVSLGVIDIHHDPLFFTLTTECLVRMISQFSQWGEASNNQLANQLEEIFKEMEVLGPYQLDKHWVLNSLRQIKFDYEKRIRRDAEAASSFCSAIVIQLTQSGFRGRSRDVLVLNVLETILRSFLPADRL